MAPGFPIATKPAISLLTALVALPLVLWSGETGKESAEPLLIDDEMPFAGTLTGDWGGLRTDLAAKGISVDLSYTEYYTGLLDGGVADDAFDFGGRTDTLIHADFGKLGLWEGGGFHTHLESRFGEAAERRFPRSGGVWPPNTGVVLPLGGSERLVASSLFFTQKLGDDTTLMLGKINAVDLLAGDPFFGGWARDRFTNVAFVAPPSGVVPPTIMGAVLSHRIDAWSFTFMGFDPEDRTNDYWPDDLFDSGVNLSLGATWTGEIAGRTSSLGITGTYSTKVGADLSDLLLPPDVQGGTEEGSYNVALSGSHLLYELADSPGKGLGVYVKAATADGNPNPIQSSVIGGFAGYGVIPNRPDDVVGIGYYHYQWSDDLKSGVAPALSVADETGIEFFYNLAVTPWFRLTADLQWIDPANARFSDAWVGGLRASVQF
jgi:porin